MLRWLRTATIGMALGGTLMAAEGPVPPCAGEAAPAYPAMDDPPVIKVWSHTELGGTWRAPAGAAKVFPRW
jgi:hypothetical protein